MQCNSRSTLSIKDTSYVIVIVFFRYDVRVHLDTIPDYSKLPKPQ